MKRRRFLAAGPVLLTALGIPLPLMAQNTRRTTTARKKTTNVPPDRLVIPEATGPKRSGLPLTIAATDSSETSWRNYTLTASIAIPPPNRDAVRLWLPLALDRDLDYQRVGNLSWTGEGCRSWIFSLPEKGQRGLFINCGDAFGNADRDIEFEITGTIGTRDRHFDIAKRTTQGEREAELRRCLSASAIVPVDTKTASMASQIIGKVEDPVARGKKLYDWVVDNARVEPGAGYGKGSIGAMLASRNYQGGSADICGLFVALSRNAGLPARLVHGLWIDKSNIAPVLGVESSENNPTDCRHCRAEFFVDDFGWIPVDPASACLAKQAKETLFGFWEMNWIACNTDESGALPLFEGPAPLFFIDPIIEKNATIYDGSSERTPDAPRISFRVERNQTPAGINTSTIRQAPVEQRAAQTTQTGRPAEIAPQSHSPTEPIPENAASTSAPVEQRVTESTKADHSAKVAPKTYSPSTAPTEPPAASTPAPVEQRAAQTTQTGRPAEIAPQSHSPTEPIPESAASTPAPVEQRVTETTKADHSTKVAPKTYSPTTAPTEPPAASTPAPVEERVPEAVPAPVEIRAPITVP